MDPEYRPEPRKLIEAMHVLGQWQASFTSPAALIEWFDRFPPEMRRQFTESLPGTILFFASALAANTAIDSEEIVMRQAERIARETWQ